MFKDGVPTDTSDKKWQWLAYQVSRSNVSECRKRYVKLSAERERKFFLSTLSVSSRCSNDTLTKRFLCPAVNDASNDASNDSDTPMASTSTKPSKTDANASPRRTSTRPTSMSSKPTSENQASKKRPLSVGVDGPAKKTKL